MTANGYVTFEVGATTFAVAVGEVKEVLRTGEVRLLPSSEHTVAGRALTLVDARGVAVPVLDLRGDRSVHHGESVPASVSEADVLLARDPGRAGVVVDRVLAVLRPGALVTEASDPAALPSYAVGILRPAGGGDPVLLVSLPEVAHAGTPAYDREDEPALGEPVLAQAGASPRS